jgi:hypothetical protein
MKINNENILEIDGVLTTPNLSASFNLKPIWLGHVAIASVQLTYGGLAPTGSFKLQASCDPGNPKASGESNQYATVTSWTDVANSATAVSASGSVLWNIVDPGYQWVRVVWTWTSGNGPLLSARCTQKGI